MDDVERLAVGQLFRLKSKLRELILEWESSAKTSYHPGTQKFYRFGASELEKLLRDHDTQSQLDEQKRAMVRR